MPIPQKHISRLLQLAINHLNGFLYSLVLLQGKQIVVSFFYLYSHHITNPAHNRVAKNPRGIFKSTHINTKKSCIHVLCKNNWSNFRSRHSYLHSFVGEDSDK